MELIEKRMFRGAVIIAMLLTVTLSSAYAGTDNVCTNFSVWTEDREWDELTNHIEWCYNSLVDRVKIVGDETSMTNDAFKPTYIWPLEDYRRFAAAIDELAPLFLDHSKADRDGVFKGYFTQKDEEGNYPMEFPFWTTSNLHMQAFGQTNWSTNAILPTWMGMTNHMIMLEVQAALTNLLWTMKPNDLNIDGERVYAGGYYTDFPSFQKAYGEACRKWREDWESGCSWDDFTYLYAVGTDVKKTNSVHAAKYLSKPGVTNVCRDYVSDASWYLLLEHALREHSNYETLVDDFEIEWHNYDVDNWPDIEANHIVFVKDLGPGQSSRREGDYAFKDNRYKNPLVQAGIQGWNQHERACVSYVEGRYGYWVFKWNVSDGLDLEPPELEYSLNICQNSDTDRDDLVDIGIDAHRLGNDTGTIVFDPLHSQPQVIIPIASTPGWYRGLPLHAYFSQGVFSNLPYQCHVAGTFDNDGYNTAFSLNTHIEASGATDEDGREVKRVQLIRPRGNVVIFNFPYENGTFSPIGYPEGINANRSYILKDLSPTTHAGKSYDMCFESGVIHHFNDDGQLSGVSASDGKSTSLERCGQVEWDEKNQMVGPNTASSSKYDVEITWDNGCLSRLKYSEKGGQNAKEAVYINRDRSTERIAALSKSMIRESNARLSSGEKRLTYGNGVVVTCQRVGNPGQQRDVYLTSTMPAIGTLVKQMTLNQNDRVVVDRTSANGKRSEIHYVYDSESGRYNNGLLKSSRLKEISIPDLHYTEKLEYDDHGWLETHEKPGPGAQLTTYYSYNNEIGGDPALSYRFAERPRKIITQLGASTVSRQAIAYVGATETTIIDGFDGVTQDTTITYQTGERSGIPDEIATLHGTITYNATDSSDGSLAMDVIQLNGQTSHSKINAFGNICEQSLKEDGYTLFSAIYTAMDSFGRPKTTSYNDGTSQHYENYTMFGPKRIVDVDGSLIGRQFNCLGMLTYENHAGAGISSEYQYDPAGNLTLQKVGGVVMQETAYDAWSRPTRVETPLGTTVFSYDNTEAEVETHIQYPDGRTVVRTDYPDGSLKTLAGSAVTPRQQVYDGLTVETKMTGAGSLGQTVHHDPLGNAIKVVKTGIPGAVEMGYKGGLRVSVTDANDNVARTTFANMRPEYQGLDINNDGELSPSGTDRMQRNHRSVDSSGVTESQWVYPENGSETDKELIVTKRSLDGRKIERTRTGERVVKERSSEYASPGRYTETISRNGKHVETREYWKWRLRKQIAYDGSGATQGTVLYDYDDLGKLQSVSDSNKGTTTYIYDNQQRLKKIIPPDRGAEEYTYVPGSTRIKTYRESNGNLVSYDYDSKGNLVGISGGSQHPLWFGYDDQRRLTQLTTMRTNDVLVTTEWKFDNVTGRLNEKLIDGVAVEKYSYKDNGQLLTTKNANNVIVSNSYQGLDRIEMSFSDGSPSIHYDSYSRLGWSTRERSGETTNSTVRVADGRPQAVTYNAYCVSGVQVTYDYATNHPGVETLTCNKVGEADRSVGVSYDAVARVASLTDADFKAEYSYNENASLVAGAAYTTNAKPVLNKRVEWDLTHDRIHTIAFVDRDNVTNVMWTYEYQVDSDRISRQRYLDGSWWVYTYDATGQVVRAVHHDTNGFPVAGQNFVYEYDDIGNQIRAGELTEDGTIRLDVFNVNNFNLQVQRTWDQQLEILGRAASDASVTVNGDRVTRQNNRFSLLMPFDELGTSVETTLVVTAVSVVGTNEYIRSVTGRLYLAASDEGVVNEMTGVIGEDSRFSYTFDNQARLKSVTTRNRTPNIREEYTYYAGGQRASRKILMEYGSDVWLVDKEFGYVYDGWNLIEEYITEHVRPTESSVIIVGRTNSYVWGLDLAGQRTGEPGQESGGIGGLLSIETQDNGTNTLYIPLCDHNGNVRHLYDVAATQIVVSYTYSPFGTTIEESYATDYERKLFSDGGFRFSTKYFDRSTGLLYYGHRFFDTQTAKWLSRDPLGEKGGVNLTAFCKNDPINKVDPLGLFSEEYLEGVSDVHPLNLFNPASKYCLPYYMVGAFSFTFTETPKIFRRTRADLREEGGFAGHFAATVTYPAELTARLSMYATGAAFTGPAIGPLANTPVGGAALKGLLAFGTGYKAGDIGYKLCSEEGRDNLYFSDWVDLATLGYTTFETMYPRYGASPETVKIRMDQMRKQDVGYNVSPESWFGEYSSLGRHGTYVVDYRGVGSVLGPVRANQQYSVGLFSRDNTVSYFRTYLLERGLGLARGSLWGGFRFTRVSGINSMNPSMPTSGNEYFLGYGRGLPNGSPEIVVDPVSTSPWPPKR